MSKEVLEILRGISQAMGRAYDGATDEKGEPIKIGLKRDDKNPMLQSRNGDMDGFGVKVVGDKLIISYHSETPIPEIHKKGPSAFEGEIEQRFANIVKFLKKEYKKAIGKALSLKSDGDAEVLLQYMNRKRSWVQATKCYTIRGLGKLIAEPEREPLDVVKNFLQTHKYGK
jgi:hypothetical protein